MIKAHATGNRGEPVLILCLAPADVETLAGNVTLVTRVRSQSGVELSLILFFDVGDDAIKDKLATFGERVVVSYAGPLLASGEVIRTP